MTKKSAKVEHTKFRRWFPYIGAALINPLTLIFVADCISQLLK